MIPHHPKTETIGTLSYFVNGTQLRNFINEQVFYRLIISFTNYKLLYIY